MSFVPQRFKYKDAANIHCYVVNVFRFGITKFLNQQMPNAIL